MIFLNQPRIIHHSTHSEKILSEWNKSSFKLVKYYDYDLGKFLQKEPLFKELINDLKPYFIDKKFVTVKFMSQVLNPGDRSCLIPLPHVDGKDNTYFLVNFGEGMTRFFKNPEHIHELDPRMSIKDINNHLKELKREFVTFSSGDVIQYTSRDIHTGFIANKEMRRIFLRICFSDYLYPKNIIERI